MTDKDFPEVSIPTITRASLTKEELDKLAVDLKKVLEDVLNWLGLEYVSTSTEVTQSGSGTMLQLACKWTYERKPDGKMIGGELYFTPDDKPEDAKASLAFHICLANNPFGIGYYIFADIMTRFGSSDPMRNSPPEAFIRAVLNDMKKSGKISWMQAPTALAQILHLEQNINETYGIDTAEMVKQAAEAQHIQIAKG